MTSPAPALDYRQTLPADWCDRVLVWKPESSLLAPYVEYLQAVVREHGAASIMIERLQELALSVCGLVRDPLFAGHLEIFGRIEALGGLDRSLAADCERAAGDFRGRAMAIRAAIPT